MYRCGGCGKNTAGKPVRVVVETRTKVYPERRRDQQVIDRGGVGTEIVREADLCSACALPQKFARAA